MPPVTLNVDADWLIDRLREGWPDIEINVRDPRPTGYKCDFKLVRGDDRLIGGLHRDGYALVLTGDVELVDQFAAWYRTIIDRSEPLYWYEWGDTGTLLK